MRDNNTDSLEKKTKSLITERSRSYIIYLILLMALIAILLTPSSATIIEWNRFWAIAGVIMVILLVLVILFHPYETKTQELEEIEVK